MTKIATLLTMFFLFCGVLPAENQTYELNLEQMNIDLAGDLYESVGNGSSWTPGLTGDGLPGYHKRFAVAKGTEPSFEVILMGNPDALDLHSASEIIYHDIPTDSENKYGLSALKQNQFQESNGIRYLILKAFSTAEHDIYDLTIVPFAIDQNQVQLYQDISASIKVKNSQGHALFSEIDPREFNQMLKESAEKSNLHDPVSLGSFPDHPDFVIITDSSLKNAFVSFCLWKRALGYNCEIKLIEDILMQYSGLDDAERVREYLKDAYNDGLRWVLLGGDETVIPVRKLYAANTNDLSVPDDYIHPSDLYYANLDGDWDADGDGIYGEPYHDDPDLEPELHIGRVPLCTKSRIENWVEKTIDYEMGSSEDLDLFSTRALISSADHMTDWNGGSGQESLIAQNFPGYIEVNSESLIELPSGDHPSPETPPAADFASQFSQGWNMTFVLAHGKPEGFATMSSNYNEWPKTYLLAGDGSSSTHEYLGNLPQQSISGLVYSIACSQAGFDRDNSQDQIFVESILGIENRGAAAFIGYTRYGWVASSYLLVNAFLQETYNGDNRIGPANEFSKLEYSYLRDLNYGLNLFGDPSMRVWTDIPSEIDVEHPDVITLGENNFSISLTSHGQPLADALLTVINAEENLFIGLSDINGQVNLDFQLENDSGIILTAWKNGHKPYQTELYTSLVLDADDELDDENALPKSFELHQNYPNPANPSTVIGFELHKADDARLEVFNVLGQKVDEVIMFGLEPGYHRHDLDLGGHAGGVYFYRLTTSTGSQTRKMILLK